MTSPAETLQQAIHLLQVGRPGEAERVLADLLQQSPENAEALALLGLSFAKRNENERAAELIGRALTLNPDNLTAQVNHAKVLTKLERWPGVAAAAAAVLASRPDHMEARRLRGQAFAALKRDTEALADLDAVATDNIATLLMRAKLRYTAGGAAGAVADYDRIIALAPAHWEALNNRGIALEALQRYEDALSSYERAAGLSPTNTSVLHNRAASLLTLRRHTEALPLFQHLIAVEPGNADNWTGHGAALASLQMLDDAIPSFDEALTLEPTSVRALVGRGTVLAALNRTVDAVADYRRALNLDPNNATAHANLAFALLAEGNLGEGFEEYEWRRKDGPIHLTSRRFDKPEWQSEDIAGKTLLLHPEQGLGDILQFARFVPQLVAQGARIILEVPAALEALMLTLPATATIVRAGTPLPPYDLHAPLMSLGQKLGLALDTIPNQVPYLDAPVERREIWRSRMAPLPKPRVGLCWSGNPAHSNDRARSVPFTQFARIAWVPGIAFVNLQRDLRDSDKPSFAAATHLTNFMPHVADLADTAALIAELDLVICVDTAIAHLAGALGKTVWILIATSADWRWLKDRDDSPWYPSARLFRQTAHGDWNSVIERVRAELAALSSQPTAISDPKFRSSER
ncbi:MAG: tetratricopeptide repeat protein [Micropepsaceae bacterium]